MRSFGKGTWVDISGGNYRVIRPSVDKCLFKQLNKYAREDENILQGIQLEI